MNSIYIQTHAAPTGEPTNDESAWLSPFQARVAAIYVKRETDNATLFLPSQAAGLSLPDTNIEFFATEKDLLAGFWRALDEINKARKERLVTFNGRKFAVPFLYVRSSIQDVAIGNRELMGDRYKLSEHIDLLEAFTFHGILAKPTLLEMARCYQLPLPVTLEGGAMQKLLGAALESPHQPLWEILAKSGLQYAALTLSLATVWSKALRIY